MRIAQVCPYAWSARGGVQTHVRSIARQLSARGHELLVIAPGDAARESAHFDRDASGASVAIVGSCVRIPFNGSIAPVCVSPAGAWGVRAALARFEPDIVHVHEPWSPSLSLFAAWHSLAPVVATFHANCAASVDAWVYRLAARCLRPVSRRIAVRLAVSRAAASCAQRHAGGDINVVPNGVDFERFVHARPFSLPPGRKLLVVNRLDRRKGFEVALRAFRSIADRFDDLLFVVVGEGPCRNLVNSLPAPIRRRVVMLGNVPDDDLPSIYAAADVFAAPATGQESFGLVLLEAMATGLPIVASNIDGYREVVRRGTDGLLVPPGDPAAFGSAVGSLLSDPALAQTLVDSGRQRVQQFTWDGIAASLEQFYLAVSDKLGEDAALAACRSPALDATS